jgi:hypothetical protein
MAEDDAGVLVVVGDENRLLSVIGVLGHEMGCAQRVCHHPRYAQAH